MSGHAQDEVYGSGGGPLQPIRRVALQPPSRYWETSSERPSLTL
jgi:hypothetical protein